MLRNYQVYVLKRRSDDAIVYVGLTRQTLYKRFGQHVFRKKIDPKEYLIQSVQEDLSIDQAVTLEEMLINQYDTRKNGLNVSPGSINGYSNYHSKEQREKWSQDRKGIPIKGRITRTGLKNSERQNKLISEANSKKVICLNNGVVYESMRQACKKLKLQESKVSLVCNGKRPHTMGFKFKFLNT